MKEYAQTARFENQLGDVGSLASCSREIAGSACVCYKFQVSVLA